MFENNNKMLIDKAEFRAILLQPSYDNPLETAQQIYEENRVSIYLF